MVETLVVKANIKKACKDMSVSSDFADVLNEKVNEMVQKAVWRAKENARRTVMGRDL